ncbi:MAG: hypothetical protein L0219_15185 [Phycisphaerales bacterium]|nr:hypothetical protein [Phycisphaerales bacterium]
MPPELEPIFSRLRGILQKHAGALLVQDDTPKRYCIGGSAGPATLKAWGGKMRSPTIPVAWVQIGKSHVSYHLMALDGSATLASAMSKGLKARMQGKTCFNFKSPDQALFKELEQLTARGIAGFSKGGWIAAPAGGSREA